MPTIGEETKCVHCNRLIVFRLFRQVGIENLQGMWVHKKSNEAQCHTTYATPAFAKFRDIGKDDEEIHTEDSLRDIVKRMRDAGVSLNEIAEVLNLPISAVEYFLLT